MLPEEYVKKMKTMLKDDYSLYEESFNQKSYRGLRINTSKISVNKFLELFPYKLEPIPWSDDGFYYNDDEVSKHPFYYAGLFYLQEPSAMLPAETLPIEENDIVLDACAAPGGKSLKLLNKLNGTGLLLSNDISASRAKALLRNIERQGFTNYFVTAEDVNKLKEKYPQTFTKILLDAPCSGEGMFRKEPSLIKSWFEKSNSYYSPIQKELLVSCIEMLKDGGKLVYSTCTFDESEDEEVIKYAMKKYPELQLLSINMKDGFVKGKDDIGVKLFPHKVNGEGHFVCLLQKGNSSINNKPIERKEEVINNCLYSFPDFDTKGIRVLRSGLLIGEHKKNSFEYSQAFAMSINEYDKVIKLEYNDQNIIKYLKGETIKVNSDYEGDVLICMEGYPLGFGKISKGIIKNKIDKGWVIK